MDRGQEQDRELHRLRMHFQDLARRADFQCRFLFSGFLSLADQSLLLEATGGRNVALSGGVEYAERRMARFGDPEQIGYEEPFPIACVRVRPVQEKFADTFSHRDFLGAILNLGLDRFAVGDLFLEAKGAYAFCTETVVPFLEEQLRQVKHTPVRCQRVQEVALLPRPRLEELSLSVAGARCDSLVAQVWRLSRSQSQELFRKGRVFVNGRQQNNADALLKDDDLVSVRGFGRFLFRGQKGLTKSGRLSVRVDLFA